MARAGKYTTSLKTKMILLIGTVAAFLMMATSLSILFQWRTLMVGHQRHNSESLTAAISLTLSDAFIYSRAEGPQTEELLERSIENYLNAIPTIKYIAVVDERDRILAHSDPQQYNKPVSDELWKTTSAPQSLATAIYESPPYGWIIETVLPLRVAGKQRGVLRIGYDAQPLRSDIQRLFFLLLSLTTGVTLITLALLYFIVDRVTQSLSLLVAAIDKTELETELEIHLPKQNDEIGFLMERFQLLRQRLYQSKQQLITAQRQIYHAERLASIGRLASGVAHEINNPLNGIRSCLFAIGREPENNEQVKEYIGLIDEGVTYIESVVKKLLGFARQQIPAMDEVNLNDVITNVTRLLEFKIKQKRVVLQLRLDPRLPLIKADGQLISEVAMNLMLNSLDAVEVNGHIIVETGRSTAKAVFFRIVDDGMGIPKADLARIFDPFFTTKGPKEGTGLGLSVSLGIVETHGGAINVESEPNRGANFTVQLPIGVAN